MRISEVHTYVVGNPQPSFGGRYFVFVKLTTACGVTGFGEVYGAGVSPHLLPPLVEDLCARYLVGEEVFKIETFFRKVYSSGYTQRPDLTVMGCLSGLEMACWDIIGKGLGRPVYDLLGGAVFERLRCYTYLYPNENDKTCVYEDAELAGARAAEMVSRGFTAVKFDPVGPYTIFDPRQLSRASLERSERFVRRLREAVGDKADLLFGTHGQMTASSALRLARRLEASDPLWLEEPVPPDDVEGMARVARATSIPVAAGERLSGKAEFLRLLQRGAVSIVQPNLGRCGGILEGKKIAVLAEAHGVQLAPHLYCGPIVGAANIQLATCSPNFLILEGILEWGGFHAKLLKKPIVWQEGYVLPPREPGLGVELDEEVAAAHPYRDEPLHLTTADRLPLPQ